MLLEKKKKDIQYCTTRLRIKNLVRGLLEIYGNLQFKGLEVKKLHVTLTKRPVRVRAMLIFMKVASRTFC